MIYSVKPGISKAAYVEDRLMHYEKIYYKDTY